MNGTRIVNIKSLLGEFSFELQKYKDLEEEKNVTWFQLTNRFSKGLTSVLLQERSSWLATKSSYKDSEEILERFVGEKILTDQTINNIVIKIAEEITKSKIAEVEKVLSCDPDSDFSASVDIYNPDDEEVIIYIDDVVVKGQKEERKSKTRPVVSEKGKKRWWPTKMVGVKKADESYHYFTNDIDNSIPISCYILAAMVTLHGTDASKLKLVVLSDGATNLKTDIDEAFLSCITFILDWYHLEKKLKLMCTMIGKTKIESKALSTKLRQLCYTGKVAMVINYLENLPEVKNEEKRSELLTYLKNNEASIIDYRKRKKIGKPIGSGRIESFINETVSKREKIRGVTWRPRGSKALAMLKTEIFNGNWDEIWHKKAA
jgi:Uncharacterised protein family (UPF0236)